MPRSEVPWYPEPGPDLRKADEDQVVRWIGGWLMDTFDHDFDTFPREEEWIPAHYHALGDYEESAAVVHPITGAAYPWTPPKLVFELLRQHRAASLSDDRGTWVSLTYEMSFPRSVKAQFTSNEDPGFRQQPPAEAYAEELRRYPRSAKRTPDWLRRGAEGT